MPAPLQRAVLAALIVVAVFVMHGPSYGSGCVAGDPMPGGASRVAVMTAGTGVAVATPGDLAAHLPGGQVCLFTVHRSGAAALLALLLTVVGLIAPVALPATLRVDRRRRAPPIAGAVLLRRLCVSRT